MKANIKLIILINLIFNSTHNIYSDNKYDLIIIGGGTAAYSAAHTANSLKKNTLIINEGLDLGGTSMNIGAIPTKHLVKVANIIRNASISKFIGLDMQSPKKIFNKINKQKRKIIDRCKKNRFIKSVNQMKYVKVIKGWGTFKSGNIIEVNNKDYHSEYFLIASGSKTKVPKIKGLQKCDHIAISNACEFNEFPKSITILGAGYLGLELGMIYSQLGVKVRLIERRPYIFKRKSEDISLEIEKALKRDNIEIIKSYVISSIEKKNNIIVLNGKYKGKEKKLLETGKLILATGAEGNTQKLNLKKAGVKIGRKNLVLVNKEMQTSNPKIYAAGDCVESPCFACIADMEARTAVNNMFSKNKKTVNYSYYPWVTFTSPEIAGAGIGEKEAKENNIQYEVSKLPLSSVPQSIISNDNIGFIKLIRNKKNDILIGATVIGENAGELASYLSFLIKNKIKISEIKQGLYPYLTLSEGIKNAAIAFDKNSIYTEIP